MEKRAKDTPAIRERKDKSVKIQLLNVRGLSRGKYGELVDLCFRGERGYNILCLTETHHTYEKFVVDENLENFSAMRKEGERKGGGLKILMEKSKNVDFEIKKSKSAEILDIEGECFGEKIKIILVYFDVRKDGKGKDNNHKIRKEIEEKVKKWKEKAVMVLGDFNAHVKMLEPERNQDDSGDIITAWVDSDKIDLMLLNADTTKCEGLYTRTEKDSKSAIDLVLVNSRMYNLCKKMNIDEEKDIISFSDHNLIEIKLNLGVKVNKSFGSKYIMEEYYTKNRNKIKEWSERVKEKWKERGSNRNIIPMLKDMEEEGEKY